MRISQGELDRYRAQIASRQDDARAYVLARLRSEARGLTVAEAREASIGIMQDCLSVYGDKAQALSAEMFDEICEAEGIDADPGEMFDDVIDSSKLAGKVHYYAGKLVDGDWDGYSGSNADLAAYYVHRSALENMARNCYKNGVRYARVGTGRETCGYCFMLSSRGFDYRSEKTASAGSHEHCDCIIVPGVDGVTKIDGYDPKGMRRRWNDCRDTLGGDKSIRCDFDALTNRELSEIKGRSREQKWVRYRNSRVNQEVETRDNGWLYRGERPKPTFATPKIKKSVTRDNPWEGRSGDRLARLGFRQDFQVDYYYYIDDDGVKRRRGLPDLANGIEIKTPLTSKNPYGAVDNYFSDIANKKDGVKRVVIDNSESLFSDDELEDAIREKICEYDLPRVSMLGKDGKLRDIKKRT